MNKNIKIPEGLIRKANEKGLFSHLKYYYILKCNRISGFFEDKDILLCFKKDCGLSEGTAKNEIRKLISLNWIRKEFNGYSLIKYDKLFEYFNYNLDLKYNKNNNTIRKGKFKIFKIEITKIKESFGRHLENHVCLEELKLNLNRQKYVLLKKLRKTGFKSLIQKTKIGHCFDIKEIIDLTISNGINLDISLSIRKISDILGFKSPSKGYKIQKFLEFNGYIGITRRKNEFISNAWDMMNMYNTLKRKIKGGLYIKGGILYYTAPNLIHINK